MSLPTNNKDAGKGAGKNQKNQMLSGGSKFMSKPKAGAAGKKPVKTGGSRGS